MGDRLRMVVDCDRRCVYFERGADFLGIAFTLLPPIRLFATISAVYGESPLIVVLPRYSRIPFNSL